MALPEGVETRKVVISPGTSPQGRPASLEVLIEPSEDHLVWLETGETIIQGVDIVRTTPYQAAVITLPTVDQTGFVDGNGLPLTEWHYKITVRYLFDGRKSGLTKYKYYKPRQSDPAARDFELMPSGEAPLYQGPPGPAGMSAYELAVKNGYEGTEQDWLSELASPNSSTGGSTHLGEGPPPVFIYGAKPRDIYIDTTNGAIYQLEEG